MNIDGINYKSNETDSSFIRFTPFCGEIVLFTGKMNWTIVVLFTTCFIINEFSGDIRVL